MQLKNKRKTSTKDHHIIVFVTSDKGAPNTPAKLKKHLEELKKDKEFLAKKEEVIIEKVDCPNWPARTVLVGLGEESSVTAEDIRNGMALAVKKLKSSETGQILFMHNSLVSPFAQEVGEGCGLANYNLGHFQTEKAAKSRAAKEIKKLEYLADKSSSTFEKGIQKGLTIANSVNMVRDLVNGPSNIVDEEHFAKQAKAVAKRSKCKIKILEKRDLERLKMGALLAVNRGSAEGAKLITLEYKPSGAKGGPILLVGKGVLFDTGGYNLKPSSGIDTMHMDMAGAALVLGVMNLLKDLNIKKHVVGITPITKNMVDAHAIKTNDIITSYSGKTIQILNTDAEGRLILADALSYGQEKWKKPEAIIDFATLTGACIIALGDRYAGLFGNNEKLIQSLRESGNQTDEGIWPMPIHREYRDCMKDDMADLRNIDRTREAGSSKAAGFLQHFIEKGNKWAHLDIAGTAFVSKPKKYDYKHGTGYGVRLMVNFLENL